MNIEKTELALSEATQEVGLFVQSITKEVEAIEARYADIVPIADTKDGYDFCKQIRKEVQPIKVDLENARTNLKRPIIEAGKYVDNNLKPLIERLQDVYKPFVAAYQEVDNANRIKEEKRQATIDLAFDELNNVALFAMGKSSIVIEQIIDDFADTSFDPKVFQNRTTEAVSKFHIIMESLTEALMQAKAREEIQEKENTMKEKEAAMLKKEEEMQAKIDALEAAAKPVEVVEESFITEATLTQQKPEAARNQMSFEPTDYRHGFLDGIDFAIEQVGSGVDINDIKAGFLRSEER